MNLKEQVEYCLKFWPETRDSDVTLTIKIWKEFYAEKIINGDMVKLKDMFDLPREDNVKRYRAKIQNEEHLYLPSLKVALARGILEDDWRKHMGYPEKHPAGQQRLI